MSSNLLRFIIRPSSPRNFHSIILQDLLSGNLCTRQHDWNTGAGVGARADKVGIIDPPRAGARAEGQNIKEVVAQAQDGTPVEVEFLLPCLGGVDDFFSDEVGQVRGVIALGLELEAGLDCREDGRAGFSDEGGPVLSCWEVLLRVAALWQEVAHGHEGDDGVAAFWGGAWVDSAGDVDVLFVLVLLAFALWQNWNVVVVVDTVEKGVK